MALRYWVGGGGTWNTTSTANWSATSGGAAGASAPTAADDVIFDNASAAVASYTVTVAAGAAVSCLTLTTTAATTRRPTFTPTSGASTITVGGNIAIGAETGFAGGMTVSATAASSTLEITSILVTGASNPNVTFLLSNTKTLASAVTMSNSCTSGATLTFQVASTSSTFDTSSLSSFGISGNATSNTTIRILNNGVLNLNASSISRLSYFKDYRLNASVSSTTNFGTSTITMAADGTGAAVFDMRGDLGAGNNTGGVWSGTTFTINGNSVANSTIYVGMPSTGGPYTINNISGFTNVQVLGSVANTLTITTLNSSTNLLVQATGSNVTITNATTLGSVSVGLNTATFTANGITVNQGGCSINCTGAVTLNGANTISSSVANQFYVASSTSTVSAGSISGGAVKLHTLLMFPSSTTGTSSVGAISGFTSVILAVNALAPNTAVFNVTGAVSNNNNFQLGAGSIDKGIYSVSGNITGQDVSFFSAASTFTASAGATITGTLFVSSTSCTLTGSYSANTISVTGSSSLSLGTLTSNTNVVVSCPGTSGTNSVVSLIAGTLAIPGDVTLTGGTTNSFSISGTVRGRTVACSAISTLTLGTAVDVAYVGDTSSTSSFTTTNVSTLTLGATAISMRGATTTLDLSGVTTFNRGTSTITFFAPTATFNHKNFTYNDLVVNSANIKATFSGTGNIACNNFTKTGAQEGSVLVLNHGVLAAGTVSLSGSSVTNRPLIVGVALSPLKKTFSAGTVSTLSNVMFQNIAAAGTGVWSGTNIGDAGNNSGITFRTPRVFFSRNVSTTWNNPTLWADIANGPPNPGGLIPLPQDDVVFISGNNSVTTGVTSVLGRNIFVNTLFTGGITLNRFESTGGLGSQILLLGGILRDGPSTLQISGSNYLVFSGNQPTATIPNISGTPNVVLSGFPGSVFSLSENANYSQIVLSNNATFTTATYNLTAGKFFSTAEFPVLQQDPPYINGTPTASFTSSTITITGGEVDLSFGVINPGTSIFVLTAASNSISGGTYNTMRFTPPAAGANTFTNNPVISVLDLSQATKRLQFSGGATIQQRIYTPPDKGNPTLFKNASIVALTTLYTSNVYYLNTTVTGSSLVSYGATNMQGNSGITFPSATKRMVFTDYSGAVTMPQDFDGTMVVRVVGGGASGGYTSSANVATGGGGGGGVAISGSFINANKRTIYVSASGGTSLRTTSGQTSGGSSWVNIAANTSPTLSTQGALALGGNGATGGVGSVGELFYNGGNGGAQIGAGGGGGGGASALFTASGFSGASGSSTTRAGGGGGGVAGSGNVNGAGGTPSGGTAGTSSYSSNGITAGTNAQINFGGGGAGGGGYSGNLSGTFVKPLNSNLISIVTNSPHGLAINDVINVNFTRNSGAASVPAFNSTVTVNITNHGLTSGISYWLEFTGGLLALGSANRLVTVVNANTFTVSIFPFTFPSLTNGTCFIGNIPSFRDGIVDTLVSPTEIVFSPYASMLPEYSNGTSSSYVTTATGRAGGNGASTTLITYDYLNGVPASGALGVGGGGGGSGAGANVSQNGGDGGIGAGGAGVGSVNTGGTTGFGGRGGAGFVYIEYGVTSINPTSSTVFG